MGRAAGGALIKGIIPADERTVSDLLQSVKTGSAEELGQHGLSGADPATQAIPPIVIGKDLGRDPRRAGWGYRPGDKPARGVDAAWHRAEVPAVPRRRHPLLRVFTNTTPATPSCGWRTRRGLFSEPDLVSVLSFKVTNLYRAAEVGRSIAGRLRETVIRRPTGWSRTESYSVR